MRALAVLALLALGLGGARAQADRALGRAVVLSRFGIVAAEHPLAAQAGALALARGGTAADAAVAANAAMGVLAPMMDGVGGDLAALVYDPRDGTVVGLDAIGPAPAAASLARLPARDGDLVPARSIEAVTVPGAVEGWDRLLRRFGRLTLADALKPAIALADGGFPVPAITASTWAGAASRDALRGEPEAARVFLPGGRPPAAGEVFANPDLARTLRLLAANGHDGFYRGPVAARIVAAAAARGGVLGAADLADYRAEWVEPIAGPYRGWTVYEMPPSTLGVAALEMLGIAEAAPPAGAPGSAGALHTLIEAKKLAYADAMRFDADPRRGAVPVAGLLAPAYLGARAALIDPARARCGPEAGRPGEPGGDTTFIAAVDRDGLMVSLMQSDFWEFGSGIVPEGTGFVLGNRGRLFSLDPASPNVLAGGKRPLDTLAPALMVRGDRRIAFGVMGGFNQAQAQAQFVADVVDGNMDIQAALDAPRFSKPSFGGCDVEIEDRVPAGVRNALAARGHLLHLRGPAAPEATGGGQAVERDARTGVNGGASDPRKDGEAVPEPAWEPAR